MYFTTDFVTSCILRWMRVCHFTQVKSIDSAYVLTPRKVITTLDTLLAVLCTLCSLVSYLPTVSTSFTAFHLPYYVSSFRGSSQPVSTLCYASNFVNISTSTHYSFKFLLNTTGNCTCKVNLYVVEICLQLLRHPS